QINHFAHLVLASIQSFLCFLHPSLLLPLLPISKHSILPPPTAVIPSSADGRQSFLACSCRKIPVTPCLLDRRSISSINQSSSSLTFTHLTSFRTSSVLHLWTVLGRHFIFNNRSISSVVWSCFTQIYHLPQSSHAHPILLIQTRAARSFLDQWPIYSVAHTSSAVAYLTHRSISQSSSCSWTPIASSLLGKSFIYSIIQPVSSISHLIPSDTHPRIISSRARFSHSSLAQEVASISDHTITHNHRDSLQDRHITMSSHSRASGQLVSSADAAFAKPAIVSRIVGSLAVEMTTGEGLSRSEQLVQNALASAALCALAQLCRATSEAATRQLYRLPNFYNSVRDDGCARAERALGFLRTLLLAPPARGDFLAGYVAALEWLPSRLNFTLLEGRDLRLGESGDVQDFLRVTGLSRAPDATFPLGDYAGSSGRPGVPLGSRLLAALLIRCRNVRVLSLEPVVESAVGFGTDYSAVNTALRAGQTDEHWRLISGVLERLEKLVVLAPEANLRVADVPRLLLGSSAGQGIAGNVILRYSIEGQGLVLGLGETLESCGRLGTLELFCDLDGPNTAESVRHEWESLPATITTVVTHGRVSLSHAYSMLRYRNRPSPASDHPVLGGYQRIPAEQLQERVYDGQRVVKILKPRSPARRAHPAIIVHDHPVNDSTFDLLDGVLVAAAGALQKAGWEPPAPRFDDLEFEVEQGAPKRVLSTALRQTLHSSPSLPPLTTLHLEASGVGPVDVAGQECLRRLRITTSALFGTPTATSSRFGIAPPTAIDDDEDEGPPRMFSDLLPPALEHLTLLEDWHDVGAAGENWGVLQVDDLLAPGNFAAAYRRAFNNLRRGKRSGRHANLKTVAIVLSPSFAGTWPDWDKMRRSLRGDGIELTVDVACDD
ncbi:hypothetical protein B0T24DRAFT_216107, partial [Lasiosphaeria ovina]